MAEAGWDEASGGGPDEGWQRARESIGSWESHRGRGGWPRTGTRVAGTTGSGLQAGAMIEPAEARFIPTVAVASELRTGFAGGPSSLLLETTEDQRANQRDPPEGESAHFIPPWGQGGGEA